MENRNSEQEGSIGGRHGSMFLRGRGPLKKSGRVPLRQGSQCKFDSFPKPWEHGGHVSWPRMSNHTSMPGPGSGEPMSAIVPWLTMEMSLKTHVVQGDLKRVHRRFKHYSRKLSTHRHAH